MIIENAKYHNADSDTNTGIFATIDGVECSVPLDEDNTHYAEILKQVADGYMLEDNDVRQYLTIAEAD